MRSCCLQGGFWRDWFRVRGGWEAVGSRFHMVVGGGWFPGDWFPVPYGPIWSPEVPEVASRNPVGSEPCSEPCWFREPAGREPAGRGTLRLRGWVAAIPFLLPLQKRALHIVMVFDYTR